MNPLSSTIELVPAVVPAPDQLPFFEELTAPPPRPVRPHLRLQPPLLADLTPRQRKAVTHGDGPLLIVAGAGAGKTTVLTRRIAWLIAEDRARPLGHPTRFLGALATLFSRARDEDVTPSTYETAARELAEAAAESDDEGLKEEAAEQAELAAAYVAYERLMRAADRIDFGD